LGVGEGVGEEFAARRGAPARQRAAKEYRRGDFTRTFS
jgi:hypothetical protein